MEKGSKKTTSNSHKKTVKSTNSNVEFKVLDFNDSNNSRKNVIENHEYRVATNAKESIDNFRKVKEIIDKESNIVKKKRKKKKKVSKKLKVISITLVFILLFSIICFILMLTIPLFDLNSVIISGTNRYDANLVANDLNLKIGENIFITMFKSNRDRIKNNYPYIEKLEYNYKFPNNLELEVIERSQNYYAFNKEDSKYYVLSKNGDILQGLDDASSWTQEILVSGITFENKVVLGDKINEVDLNKIKKFESFKETLIVNLDEVKITKVTFQNEYMKIYINSAIEVIFEYKKNVEDYSFSMLKLILNDVQGQSGTIDMTKEDPTFVKSN